MKILSLIVPLVIAEQCELSANEDNKPGFCTDVSEYAYRTNSWVCKNCFNVRVQFKMSWIGAVGHWFDNRDYVWIAFKGPVNVVKFAGPADEVVPDGRDDDGNYRFKIGFNDNFNPGDGRIDVNIEFNDSDNPKNREIAWAKLCPCGVGTLDMCDPAGNDYTAANGYWQCGWSRTFEKQNRMNKCEWTCRGDDEGEEDDYKTGGKARCFREQGKQHRDRAQRVLGEWKLGKNSIDKITCE